MSSSPRILIAEPQAFSADAVRILEGFADVEMKEIGQQDLKSVLAEYDAVWIRLHLKVGSSDLPEKMKCRYVVTATTGIDHVDTVSLAKQGCDCLSLRGHDKFLDTIKSTSELAMGLLIALVRNIPRACRSVESGEWERDRFVGRELNGLTAGVIGYGRLGRNFAKLAKSFGMSVKWFDPYVDAQETAEGRLDSIKEVLMECDVVSIHVKLTDETQGLINSDSFAAIAPGSFLINTSRGGVVDEDALLAALKTGRLAGAAVDVVSAEPNVGLDHPLVKYARSADNLIITPHIGGATHDAMRRCEDYMAGVLVDKLQNGG